IAETKDEAQKAVADAMQAEERYKAEMARIEAEADAAAAIASQAEEHYKVEIARINAEINTLALAASENEEAHKIEIARIKAEAEAAAAIASQAEEGYKVEIARINAEVNALALAASEKEEGHKAEIARIKAEAEARGQESDARTRQAEENYRVEIAGFRAEADAMAAAANQADERYKAEIAKVRAEAEAQVQQVEADARRIEERSQAKVEEAISNTQVVMLAIEEAEKKLVESEARIAEVKAEAEMREVDFISQLQEAREAVEALRNNAAARIEIEVMARLEAEHACADALARLQETEKIFHAESAKFMAEAEAKIRESESNARRAQTRSRQVYLVSRLSFTLVEQIFGGAFKMIDEKGGLIIPPGLETETCLDDPCSRASELNTNGSIDPGDLSLPDRLKALFEVLASAQFFGDEGKSDDNEAPVVTADYATNENTIRTSAGAIPMESVIP
ncbi:MAG: hypothetical protein ACREEM_31965, partial [Blastocatellia bacterium]